ncbi:Pectate lyase A [Paramyrothecium foliicola]|nr:Pectate lyase A [Paramyrothecium foliicola]
MQSLRIISAVLALTGAAMATTSAECKADIYKLEGYGSGAIGGGSSDPITVKTCTELRAAASQGGNIHVFGFLNGCGIIDLVDNTTLEGGDFRATISEGGVRIKDANNVIVRNMGFAWPLNGQGSLIVEGSTQVWINHNDFNMGRSKYEHDFGSELEIKNSDLVTVSWNIFMQTINHQWKGATVEGEANGSLQGEQPRVTYHHNFFFDVMSHAPSISGATAHLYSNCIDYAQTYAVSASHGAKVLIESNAFVGAKQAIVTDLDPQNEGSVTERDNEFYDSPTRITKTGHAEPPYNYTVDPASCICDYVCSNSAFNTILSIAVNETDDA